MPTPIVAGTDLSGVLNASGSFELQAGTHSVSTGFTMAADVTLTAAEGAELVIRSGQILKFADRDRISGVEILIESNARLQAEAVSGDTHVDGAVIEDCILRASGTITTTPLLRLGQGFNSYHRNNIIQRNDFYGVICLEEVGDANHYLHNRFFDVDGLRPLQIWGSNHRVIGNLVTGGIFGISLLGKANLAADRRPCSGNVIAGNIVLDTSEEGISLDTVGNVAAECLIREYDTIKTLGGSSVVTLNSANWAAQTTYTGSKYDLVVVSATNASMVGRRFPITTHLGGAFTLNIGASDYANLTIGDGVSVQMQVYDNVIANNVIIPRLTSDRAYTSGVVLHGIGIGTIVANNIVFGANDGVGSGDTAANFQNFAIRETSLNGVTATDSVTGLARRCLVGLNTIVNNRSLGGGYGADYRDYGSNPAYTPPASTYTGNATTTAAAIDWVGGQEPIGPDDFCLAADSSLIGAGSYVGAWALGYAAESFANPPPIGARGVGSARRGVSTVRGAAARRASPDRRASAQRRAS